MIWEKQINGSHVAIGDDGSLWINGKKHVGKDRFGTIAFGEGCDVLRKVRNFVALDGSRITHYVNDDFPEIIRRIETRINVYWDCMLPVDATPQQREKFLENRK